MSDLIFHAGAECYELYGALSKRTSLEEDVAETFTRTGTAYYVDRNGVLRIAEANVLRTEWTGSDFSTPNLLLEDARTNICLRSEDFATTWVNTRTTDGASAIVDPAGGTDSFKLSDDSTSSATHYIFQSISKAGSALEYAFSIYVRAAQYSKCHLHISDSAGGDRVQAEFNLTAATAGSVTVVGSWVAGESRITPLHTDWYRLEITGTSDTTATVRVNFYMDDGTGIAYDGDGSSGMNIYGASLEQAPFASSYIQTVGSTVTRNAETLFLPFVASPQEMTVYVKFEERGTISVSNQRVFHLGSSSVGADPRVTVRSNGTNYTVDHDNGTTTPTASLSAAPSIGQEVEIRMVLAADGSVTIGQSIDGAAETTASDTTTAVLGAAWAGQLVYLNSGGSGNRGFGGVLSFKIARGTKTMAEMRVLGV